jgi:hypothetical protein
MSYALCPNNLISNYMNNLIQSLPSPHLQRGNYSHMDGGVMDGRWSDIGDDGDEDLLQIPVSAGCQNEVSSSESRFLMAAAQRKSIWEKHCLSDIIMSGGIFRREGRSRGLLGPPHARAARPGLGHATCVWGPLEPPLHPVFRLRGSSGKIGFLMIFPNFYWKLDFCTKTRHQSNSAENSVSPC